MCVCVPERCPGCCPSVLLNLCLLEALSSCNTHGMIHWLEMQHACACVLSICYFPGGNQVTHKVETTPVSLGWPYKDSKLLHACFCQPTCTCKPTRTHTHTRTHTNTCTHTHMHKHTHTHKHMHTHTHAQTNTHTHTQTHAHTHMHKQTHAHTHTHMYIHMCCTQMYTCTVHAYTHKHILLIKWYRKQLVVGCTQQVWGYLVRPGT